MENKLKHKRVIKAWAIMVDGNIYLKYPVTMYPIYPLGLNPYNGMEKFLRLFHPKAYLQKVEITLEEINLAEAVHHANEVGFFKYKSPTAVGCEVCWLREDSPAQEENKHEPTREGKIVDTIHTHFGRAIERLGEEPKETWWEQEFDDLSRYIENSGSERQTIINYKKSIKSFISRVEKEDYERGKKESTDTEKYGIKK